jgi:hypothetical protein
MEGQMEGQLSIDTVDPLADAVAWKRKNQTAYSQLVEWAYEDQKHFNLGKRGSRPSIGLYAELLRRPHFANRLRLVRSDVAFLVNNNIRADLARLIMRDEPAIKFETRRATADVWNGEA